MIFDRVTLEGDDVMLVPLGPEHKEGLESAVSDGQLWELFVTLVPHKKDIEAFIKHAMKAHLKGDGLAFAIIDKKSGRIAGSTRFMKANLANKRLEIGYTFLSQTFQGTSINTEAKLLMLRYGFEELNLNRVELLTDYLNFKSRNAILRLGAKEEGVLRNHMLMPDGRVRDSVVFSIIKSEWVGVKLNLIFKLKNRRK